MAIQLRASSSFSSVPFSTRSYTHDVFLSFRGEDTRRGFTGHLYSTLVKEGINTFIDDGLPRGEEISQSLLRAIEGSKLSLIVFSENYAASKWCLDELVHILHCKRSKKHMVRPIFLTVDPSDVRSQSGTYGKALAEHEGTINKDKVLKWREALSEAGKLSGWHFQSGYEYELIDQIIKEISPQVKEPTKLDVAKYPVGIDSRVQDMLEILDVGGSDVRMVGIWGIGGIGKTTIAKAVYNTIAREFERSCFLANVKDGDLVKLHNDLLSEIMKEKGREIKHVHEGITLLRESLKDKKILLVLDDVDDLDQLEQLAGKIDWFGPGSRVIITTRYSQLLNDHEVKLIYKVPELAHHEAVKLFSSNAFKGGKSLGAKLLVAKMVKYARGIPLALKVLGSHLRNKSVDEWESMLDDFRLDPPKCIQDILNISYAGLQDRVQKVFLDIACFFKRWKRNDVIQVLEGCNRINPKYSIKVLEGKSLISVDEYDYIRMHDLLEDMGKDKVMLESKEPGERSRLWHHKDVHNVLTENTGTSKIEGIIVNMPTEDEIHLSPKCFENMKNLMIFVNVNARFCGKVDYLPTQLRLLDWSRWPLHSLPSNFNTSKIVHLKMPHSCISNLGFKRMQNLKSLNLRGCAFLAQSPDLSGSPNLEFLDLSRCKSLEEVHPSVGSLEKLVCLDLEWCSNLVKLPEKVNWRSLQTIRLYGCKRLESFPEIDGEMKHLTCLTLWDNRIKALPSSISYLINLMSLELIGCREFTDLPGSIYELHRLGRVWLEDCPKLVTFPNKVDSEVGPTYSTVDHGSLSAGCTSLEPDNLVLDEFRWRNCSLSNSDFLGSFGPASTLREIDLSESSIVNLSEGIIRFVQLRTLKLMGCRRLVEIPELPPGIEMLDVRNCESLERISKLSNILERKESQKMIEEMDLTECWRLWDNLVEMANEEEVELDADLFSCLLSSQQSGFKAKFPVRKSKVPEWFSCQMDYKGCREKELEFEVEVFENFKWENTGLAIWVAGDQKRQGFCTFTVHIYINETRVTEVGPVEFPPGVSDHVWLQYKPFHEMRPVGEDLDSDDIIRPLPPFSCRVIVNIKKLSDSDDKWSIKSCGVHLVMSPNEDICMELIRPKNRRTDCEELSDDDEAPWNNLVRDDFCWRNRNLSNSDFLGSFGPTSTLRELDLSNSSFVILSKGIIRFVQLRTLKLMGCRRLVEIPELPPGIEMLDVRNCESLEKISKLSNILERKESQKMIEKMNLTNCWRLCDNLVEMATEDEVELDADFFSSLLSSQQSGFKATFPVRKCKVPEWFSCQMDFKGHQVFEFDVEVLENFKWENTGLAIWVAGDQKRQGFCIFVVHIFINETRVKVGPVELPPGVSDHVWLQYKPFHEMRPVGEDSDSDLDSDDIIRPLPPFSCRVIVNVFGLFMTIKSCGVHLVMPPNEDICMKLIRAEHRPKQRTDCEGLSDEELCDEALQDFWDDYRLNERTDSDSDPIGVEIGEDSDSDSDALLENEDSDSDPIGVEIGEDSDSDSDALLENEEGHDITEDSDYEELYTDAQSSSQTEDSDCEELYIDAQSSSQTEDSDSD